MYFTYVSTHASLKSPSVLCDAAGQNLSSPIYRMLIIEAFSVQLAEPYESTLPVLFSKTFISWNLQEVLGRHPCFPLPCSSGRFSVIDMTIRRLFEIGTEQCFHLFTLLAKQNVDIDWPCHNITCNCTLVTMSRKARGLASHAAYPMSIFVPAGSL